jgi:putative tricarboxylic transport membrane protein
MKGKKIITRTHIEALVVLLGVGGYIWAGLSLPSYYQMTGVPGPSFFPLILGAIMAAGALWLLIFPGKQEKSKRSPSGSSRWSRLLKAWRFFLMWGLLIAYVFLLPVLGFVISSAVLLAVFFFLLGEKRWYLGIPISLVFTIGIYIAFAKGLQIRLPLGILEGVFRWW